MLGMSTPVLNRRPKGAPASAGGQFAEKQNTADTLGHLTPDDADYREPRPYVIVEGGLVQNNPTLPVIDLDFLHDVSSIYGQQDDVQEVRDLAMQLGAFRIVERIDRWAAAEHWTFNPAPVVATQPANGNEYVHLEGGLVQNNPTVPVIDLEFLDDGGPDDVDYAVATRDTARELGLTDIGDRIDRWIEDTSPEMADLDVIDELRHDDVTRLHDAAIRLGLTRAAAVCQARFDDLQEPGR